MFLQTLLVVLSFRIDFSAPYFHNFFLVPTLISHSRSPPERERGRGGRGGGMREGGRGGEGRGGEGRGGGRGGEGREGGRERERERER